MKQYLKSLGYDLEDSYITDPNIVEEVHSVIEEYLLENTLTDSVLDYIEMIGFSINDFDEYIIE